MHIEGPRIILRAIELKDTAVLFELINNPRVEFATGGWSFPVSKEKQEKWIKNQIDSNQSLLRTMIEVKESKETIGTCILSDIDYKNGTAEVHIKLLDIYQGEGYGTETINTLINYAFEELRLNCIYASILEDNDQSVNLFAKCNFKEEGTLRQRIYKSGSYKNLLIYSKLKSDHHGNR